MPIELTKSERDLLAVLYESHRNRTKAMLRNAWETGDYSALTNRDRDEQILQSLRNTHGPSWLHGVRLATIQQPPANGTPGPKSLSDLFKF